MAHHRRPTHHPGLDGLRGIAVAAVLAYHAGFSWAQGGYLGVSVFFTLSGFLITSLLLAENQRSGTIALGAFWGRRFRRLLPAAIVALAGILLFVVTVGSAEQHRGIDGDVLAALAYVANWRFILEDVSYGDVFGAPSPALHFWSLAIEEQFYVLFPPLVAGLLAVRRGERALLTSVLVALLGASVAASFLLADAGQDRIYFGTDTRAAELLAGAVLAIAVSAWGRPRTRIAQVATTGAGVVALLVLGVAAATVPQDTEWLYRGGFAGIAALSTLAVFSLARESRWGAALGNPVLGWLGLRSYALYLYHWPIFLWLDATRTGLDQWPLFGLRMLATAALAEISYHVVEMPFRRGTVPQLGMRLGAPTAALAVGVLAFTLGQSAPAQLLAFDVAADDTPAPAPAVEEVEPQSITVLGGRTAQTLAGALAAAIGTDDTLVVDDKSRVGCVAPCLARVESEWTDAVSESETVVFLLGPGDPLWADAEAVGRVRAAAPPTARVLWVTHPVDGPGVEPSATPPADAIALTDAVNAMVGEVANFAGDEVVDLARLVEPPPRGEPPVRIRVALAPEDPVLVGGIYQVVAAILDGALSVPETLRILVVGDSVSHTLALGIQRWGTETGHAAVWNASRPGCGILRPGEMLGFPRTQRCVTWADFFPAHVREFAPDLVIMHSGPFDLIKRKLEENGDWLTLGDPELAALMRSEYAEAVSLLAAGGAPVLWLDTPCFSPELGATAQEWLGPERRQVQDEILYELAAADPRLHVFDLESVACPGGVYEKHLNGFTDARWDGIHFSEESAMWITAEHLAPVIEELTGAPVSGG